MYNWFLYFITALSLPKYQRSNSPRGLCVIINNIEFIDVEYYRKGAEIDQKCIKDLFQGLHFTVEEYTNLSQREMEDKFQSASKTNHTNYDMFVSVVMSHGGAQDKIYGSDHNWTPVVRLMASFSPSNCPSLLGKPKLFFFQSCRGEARDPGQKSKRVDWHVDSPLTRTTIPQEADFLLAFATPPGYVAYRDPDRGSTYIQKLVDVLGKYHSTTHLLDMLTEVNRRVAEDGAIQIPAPTHTLRKQVFL